MLWYNSEQYTLKTYHYVFQRVFPLRNTFNEGKIFAEQNEYN